MISASALADKLEKVIKRTIDQELPTPDCPIAKQRRNHRKDETLKYLGNRLSGNGGVTIDAVDLVVNIDEIEKDL